MLNCSESLLGMGKELIWRDGEIITQDEITRDKEKAKNNHVEATHPGQLIGQDTFSIGCLKGLGRIDHHVAGDCFSSFGAANIYDNKPTKVSPDVVENHLAKKVTPVKIESPYRLWNRGYLLA